MAQMQSGELVFKAIWPANATPVAVDGSGTVGRSLCGWSLGNLAAAPRYIKLYDKATAPVVGTDVPKVVLAIPASSARDQVLSRPVWFGNGLWVSVTGGNADTDATAPAAGDVTLNLLWQ